MDYWRRDTPLIWSITTSEWWRHLSVVCQTVQELNSPTFEAEPTIRKRFLPEIWRRLQGQIIWLEFCESTIAANQFSDCVPPSMF